MEYRNIKQLIFKKTIGYRITGYIYEEIKKHSVIYTDGTREVYYSVGSSTERLAHCPTIHASFSIVQ